jgi:hypothetical protein
VRDMASSKAVENVPRSNWLVNREGWLQKQSEGMLGKKWQKRWFVLCGYTVRYRRVGLSQLGSCLCVLVLVRVPALASAEALRRGQLCSHGPDAEARKIFLIDNIVDVAAGPPDKPTQFWLQVSNVACLARGLPSCGVLSVICVQRAPTRDAELGEKC